MGRFLAATELATQYIVNHPDESWNIFAATSAELNDELNHKAWYDTISRFALRPAAFDEGRYQRFEEYFFAAGMIPSVNDASLLAVDVTAK